MNSLIRANPDTGEDEIFCPRCGAWHPREMFEEFTMVPRYAHLLTPVVQCRQPLDAERECRHIFAVTQQALAMRQNLALGMEEKE